MKRERVYYALLQPGAKTKLIVGYCSEDDLLSQKKDGTILFRLPEKLTAMDVVEDIPNLIVRRREGNDPVGEIVE